MIQDGQAILQPIWMACRLRFVGVELPGYALTAHEFAWIRGTCIVCYERHALFRTGFRGSFGGLPWSRISPVTVADALAPAAPSPVWKHGRGTRARPSRKAIRRSEAHAADGGQ